jgi:hypothetical protein
MSPLVASRSRCRRWWLLAADVAAGEALCGKK